MATLPPYPPKHIAEAVSIPDEYQTLEILARKASPGPWVAHDWRDYDGTNPFWFVDLLNRPAEYYCSDDNTVVPNHFDEDRAESDIKYIAAANPVVVMEMITTIRKLRWLLSITRYFAITLIVIGIAMAILK